jgi:hypothetical protein
LDEKRERKMAKRRKMKKDKERIQERVKFQGERTEEKRLHLARVKTS